MKRATVRTIPTEDTEQIIVFSWAQMSLGRYPELKWLHHIPNGGKRSKAEAGRFKAMGVRSGVSDIFLPVSRGGYHGLYVEMKALDGKPTSKQLEFLVDITAAGYLGRVCYGADEAIETIEQYLKGKFNSD